MDQHAVGAARVERTPAAPTTGPKKPAPAGKFEVPDLVGLDFVAARAELRKRNLGWQIVFHESGSDRSVVSTDPPAGHTVRRGVTVKLMVAGAAPPVRVPDVAGDPCAKAANRLIDEGLYPDYPTERAGRVIRQEPEPGADLRWNDRVEIYCGKAPAVEPSTAPPA